MNSSLKSPDDEISTADQRPDSQMSDIKYESPLRPTHRLDQIKIGENGVQLLVSTHDHLYDAANVEGGNNSFQCIGGWSETSIHELGQMLISHQSTGYQSHDTAPEGSAFKGRGHVIKDPNQDFKPPRKP
ncbi:uncharacterized protein CT0861_02346 [Colletotrichum tofieldiae]|uniref:Uncharacterized protein n=1 Tax=Colletotrichum tofieldiae TaxID=708197 RepID=A0A166W1S8_9PEZI|nr:uncharacterized protein CT0861_02346 [Colletotrichum tofieldiae]